LEARFWMKIEALALPPKHPFAGAVAVPKGQAELNHDLYCLQLSERLKEMAAVESPKVAAAALQRLERLPEVGPLPPTLPELADLLTYLLPTACGWTLPIKLEPTTSPTDLKAYREMTLEQWTQAAFRALSPT
jgi:hypothetical protein